jgi:hypothetical protein
VTGENLSAAGSRRAPDPRSARCATMRGAMTVVRVLVGVAGALGVLVILSSAVRSVVLPRAFPARAALVSGSALSSPGG